MSEFILIFVKTNSLQVYNLVRDEFTKIYGEKMVGESLAALEWNLDSVADALTKKFKKEGKRIYVIRDEGFIEEDEEKLRPFIDKLLERDTKCIYILDTLKEEELYSGSDLKLKILDIIYNFKNLLDTLL